MKKLRARGELVFWIATAVLILIAPVPAARASVISVVPATLTTNTTVDFNSLAVGVVDAVLSQTGVSFGEHFAGQTVAVSSGFDTISGAATNPLALATGPAGNNLGILSFGGSNMLDGAVGGAVGDGRGGVAALFDQDQQEIGFNIVGVNGSTMVVSFLSRSGGLLDTLTLAIPADGAFAFRSTNAFADISGITITNTDSGGIAYDNVRFNTGATAVPEPATLVLLGLGLAGLGFTRRRRAS